LAHLGAQIPFICTAQEVNLAMVVAIMKTGALDVLSRPVIDEILIGALRLGLENSAAALQRSRKPVRSATASKRSAPVSARS
jgi:FixJ family two-component response regulator